MTQESEEFKDDFIKEIIVKGKRPLPNTDFDNKVMLKIASANAYKEEIAAKLMLSLKYFIMALVIGLALGLFLLIDKVSLGLDLTYIGVLGLFILSVAGILNVDNYKRLLNKYSYKSG